MNGDKRDPYYILGQIIGYILMLCLASIGIALTVKLILWIFNGI